MIIIYVLVLFFFFLEDDKLSKYLPAAIAVASLGLQSIRFPKVIFFVCVWRLTEREREICVFLA